MSVILFNDEAPGFGGIVTASLARRTKNLVGVTTPGGSPSLLSADVKIASRFTFEREEYVTKLVAYLDGLGAGSNDQVVRAVVYNGDDNVLRGYSSEVTIPIGMEPTWVSFGLTEPLLMAEGDYDLGLHAGHESGTARSYSDPYDGDIGSLGPDEYDDGPFALWGSRLVQPQLLSIYAACAAVWSPADDDLGYLARLPYREAQRELRPGGRVDPRRAQCAWHGTGIDADRGSFALVDPAGPLADLVGQRLRLQGQFGRIVFAYCHAADDEINGDISLSRRLYSSLSVLTTYPIAVTVTTIPGTVSVL